MLNGKIALITGASRGIGRAIALKFASLGADVALIYAGNRKKAEQVADLCRRAGVRAEFWQCDVSDFAAVGQTVAEIKKHFGALDILVNNAGRTQDGLIISMKEAAFDLVVDTNLKGSFNMIRHCTPLFLRQRAGKIINISSVAGLTGNAGQANYSAAKAGIIGLTKTVAKELAGKNICCNAIAPGLIKTDMTENLPANNQLSEFIPMKRWGRPEEVAELAAFLAADTSDYITGEVIRIDGGLAI